MNNGMGCLSYRATNSLRKFYELIGISKEIMCPWYLEIIGA